MSRTTDKTPSQELKEAYEVINRLAPLYISSKRRFAYKYLFVTEDNRVICGNKITDDHINKSFDGILTIVNCYDGTVHDGEKWVPLDESEIG